LDLSGDLEAVAKFGFDALTPFVPDQTAPPPVEIPASPKEPAPSQVVKGATPTLETPAQVSEPPAGFVEEGIPADLEDSRIEVEFYLENGFLDEARQAVAALEEKCPGSPFVAELRQRLDERPGEASTGEPLEQLAPADEALRAEPPTEVVQAKPEFASPPVPASVEEEPALEEWELPTDYAVPPQPEPAMGPVVPPPVTKAEAPLAAADVAPPPPVREPAVKEPVAAEGGGMEILGGLAEDLALSIDKLAPPASSPEVPGPPRTDPSQGVAQLSGLLAEMEETSTASAPKDDPETHYNLGVAFREMGLLDESIGEFQKVVRGSVRGNYPPNFLQACSLLAICFMEKKMPAIAVKWYKRALETPDLDEEALMALEYDLGVAYEQAGDSRNALERYTEVYSQNIDFRDVADKIRELQQKA
jgi:tetratricopeptide (TPR) repeat protein